MVLGQKESAASIRGDIAAGTLLIREAGGFVTGADGEADFLETGSICCGSETMHRELLALLGTVRGAWVRAVLWASPMVGHKNSC
jgi:hypothetical protein